MIGLIGMKKNLQKQSLVSIVIPTYNSELFIEPLLKSVKNQSYKAIETIVVDNNSKDKTKDISRKFTPLLFNKGPERSAQRNFGVKKSSGKYVLIIDSDMVLAKNLVEDCVNSIEKNKSFRALVIPEVSFGDGFWAKCKALERSFYIGIPWIEGARFFDKKLFSEIGGYNENNTGTEDYDLPQRIREKHGDLIMGRAKEVIYHNEGYISLIKTCKKKFYYAQKLNVYRSVKANEKVFKKQASILNRYQLFFSDPIKLFKNPVVGIGMLYMKTCEFAFGGAGYLYGALLKK